MKTPPTALSALSVALLVSLTVATVVGVGAGCASSGGVSSSGSGPSGSRLGPGLVLTREDAFERSRHISKVIYSLWFGFNATSTSFDGRSVIQFHLEKKAPPKKGASPVAIDEVQVDFEGGTLTGLTLNGETKTDFEKKSRFDGSKIRFSPKELLPGANRIEIAYTHPFNPSGSGLTRFVDPKDGRVYLYSQMEPFSAHKVFPCFDQPDLRASFELTVEAPKDWQVVTAVRESEITKLENRHSWAFPPTQTFSPHVLAIHAGPYKVWGETARITVDDEDSESGDREVSIPLRVFARQSMAPFVDYREWFEIAKHGMEYFAVQFTTPFPYPKYDQIIVPEFEAMGMENVAASTFSEDYIFRSHPTVSDRRERAELILHELAHMWFGDLVSIRWWSGLWLKESFATFMASQALAKTTRFSSGAWQFFHSNSKAWALQEDQSPVSHPIDQPVADTDQARAIFDGITYAKGASVLKQLHAYLGEEAFTDGLQRYFERFAGKSSTLPDFFASLSEASGQNLSIWQKLWVQFPGVNSMKLSWSCIDDEKHPGRRYLNQFSILQTEDKRGAPDNILRPHRTKIAFFSFGKNDLLRHDETIETTYKNEQTIVTEVIGMNCPDFIFPNATDTDYVRMTLDPESRKSVKAMLLGLAKAGGKFGQNGELDGNLMRQMLWRSMWDEVLAGEKKPEEFLSFAIDALSHEKNDEVLSFALSMIASDVASEETALRFLSPLDRVKWTSRLENLMVDAISHSPRGGDLQRVWLWSYLGIADSKASVARIKNWIALKGVAPSPLLTQESRWEAWVALSRQGMASEEIEKAISQELVRDPNERGKKFAAAVRAASSSPGSKNEWMKKVSNVGVNSESSTDSQAPQGSDALSWSELRAAMASIQTGSASSREGLAQIYFDALPKLALSVDEDYLDHYTKALYPSRCSQDISDQTDSFLSSNSELPEAVKRSLRILSFEESRCSRILNGT